MNSGARIAVWGAVLVVLIGGAIFARKSLLVEEEQPVDLKRGSTDLMKQRHQKETLGSLPAGVEDQLEELTAGELNQIAIVKYDSSNQPDMKAGVVGRWFTMTLYSTVPAEIASLVIEGHLMVAGEAEEYTVTSTINEFVGSSMEQGPTLRPFEPTKIGKVMHLFIPADMWRHGNDYYIKIVGGKKYRPDKRPIDNGSSLYTALATRTEGDGLALLKTCTDLLKSPDPNDPLPPTLAVFAVGHRSQIEFLMKNGGNAKAVDRLGMGIMFYAARSEISGAVKEAKRYGGDPNGRVAIGWEPIHNAAISRHPQQLADLIAMGADVDAKDGNGEPTIYQAVYANDPRMVTAIAMVGADKTFLNGNGVSAMHVAGANLELVKAFIKGGFSMELRTKEQGYTPLLVAANGGADDVIAWLIEQGADVKAKDKQGRDMYQVAEATGMAGWESWFPDQKHRRRRSR